MLKSVMIAEANRIVVLAKEAAKNIELYRYEVAKRVLEEMEEEDENGQTCISRLRKKITEEQLREAEEAYKNQW